MASRQISRAFKDISLSFDPHPVTGDLPTLKNEIAIKRSIRNLIQTNKTERFFNPEFGGDIRDNLFDFVDEGSAVIVKRQVELLIQNYEPRVSNVDVQVNVDSDNNAFEIDVFFEIVGQDFPTQQFNFILEAAR